MMPRVPSCHRLPCGGLRAARTLVFVALVSYLAASSGATHGDPAVSRPWTDEELAGLVPFLAPGTVLVLGELHGTVESPDFVSHAVKLAVRRGLSVTVALEIARQESGRASTFLASAGEAQDHTALLAGPFWQSTYQDGRRSRAMAALLDDLRGRIRAGDPVHVVLYDRTGVRAAEREQAMAEAVAEAAARAPGDVVVTLVGSLHARLARGGHRGVSDPMALRITKLLPEHRVVTLRLSYAGGTAWTCGSDGCGTGEFTGRDEPGRRQVVASDTPDRYGFHGAVHLGTIHASPPAVEARRISSTPTRPPSRTMATEHVPRGLESRQHSARQPRSPVSGLGEWPQWMGPHGNGALDLGMFPLDTDVSLEIDWRRDIGTGYSSITISRGRALTLELDSKGVGIVALDVSDGSELWRARLADPEHAAREERLENPLSTPASDGQRVFAIHPAGRLFALSAADGSHLWSRDLVEDFGAAVPSYGMSTSPVLRGNRLYVMVGGQEGNNLVAFDPATGEVLLSVGYGKQGSYATPVVDVAGDRPQIVVPAGDKVYAVRGAGELLWSYSGLSYPDRDPLLLPGDRVFMAFQEYAVMLDVSEKLQPSQVREIWRSERLGNSYSPAVHHEGAIYGFGGDHLTCVKATTGEVLWRHAMGDGSLVRVDDHLVVMAAMRGQLHLVAARPDAYQETAATLTVFPPGNHSPTPPSAGAGRVFLRGKSEMVVVRLVGASPTVHIGRRGPEGDTNPETQSPD